MEQAVLAVRAAYAEAVSLNWGVGIVKLMGRESGFIAAETAVASAQANICLIPENPIPKDMVIRLIERRFQQSRNCVIIVAEASARTGRRAAAATMRRATRSSWTLARS